jgi:hypothetical protein
MHSRGMKQLKSYRNSVTRLSTTLMMVEATYTGEADRRRRLYYAAGGGVGCGYGCWR